MIRFLRWIKVNTTWLLIAALIAKLFLFRVAVLDSISFAGVASDLGAISLLMALPACFVTGRWRQGLQAFVALLISTVWFAAAIYYSYYGNIPTYYTLSNLDQVGQISESITASIEPYMSLFFIDFVIIGISLFVSHQKPRLIFSLKKEVAPEIWRARIAPVIVAALSIALIVGSLLTSRHIENGHALAKRLGVLTYQIAVSGVLGDAQQQHELSSEELASLRNEVQEWFAGQDKPEHSLYHGIAEGLNLIVIQVEAMQNFVIGLEVNGQEVTPFLNKFTQQSFYFNNIYQQIAEGNTSDAEFMMNAGAYPNAMQATSKSITGKEVPSLPRLLAEHNYQSYTFHVNDVTFWNRNELYPAFGFTEYFDKPSFTNDHFNSFGASDEQLYSTALDKLGQFQEKGERFYAQLVTTSSHHPFKIPEQYQELQLPQELVDTQLGHYLQAIHYTDKQLGSFIEQLQQEGILEDSVVAIYGDHFGLQPKDNDPAWVSQQLGINYHETITRMNIPFIVAVPGVEGEEIDQVGGQLDMLPTVLNLLGIDEKESELMLFGSDLLNISTNTIGVRYYLPTGSFFNDELFFIPGTSFKDGKAISLTTLQEVERTPQLRDDYNYVLEMMTMSDRYTSSYAKRK